MPAVGHEVVRSKGKLLGHLLQHLLKGAGNPGRLSLIPILWQSCQNLVNAAPRGAGEKVWKKTLQMKYFLAAKLDAIEDGWNALTGS